MSAGSPSFQWTARDGWMLAALLALSLFAFRGPWAELLNEISRREDNSYIFVAPLVALYLLWLRRSRFRFVRRRASLAGCGILVLAAGIAWWGEQTDTRVAMHLGAILSFIACFVTFMGFAVIRQFMPVVIALFVLIPVPGEARRSIATLLQGIAVFVTQDVLSIVGVPAERQGNVILIRGTPILVGEACDGMRMVMALALTYFTFVFSIPLKLSTRLVLLVVSPAIAIACNLVRLVATGLAYAYSTPDLAESVHDVAGWFMLPLAIVLLLGLVRLMRWMDVPVYSWRFLQA